MLRKLVFALALAPAWACAAELPDSFQLAPEAVHLRINGLSVSTRVFTSNLEPARACAQLERHWQRNDHRERAALCRRVGEWLLISHPAGRFVQAAQLKKRGDGSQGLLSELDPHAAHVAASYPQIPLPAGARLVNAVQSTVGRDSVAQFTLELPWTPAASLLRLRRLAREMGWASVAGFAASVVDFQRGETAARAIALGDTHGCTLVLVEHRPAGPGP